MEAASSASVTAERAGQGLKLAADLYGPSGATRWFLAVPEPSRAARHRRADRRVRHPAGQELHGPRLVKVDHYDGLNERTTEAVALPGPLAARYERFAIGRDWTAVNIPPDMPTVGTIIAELYEQTTGDRIDGVIAADRLAVAEILRVAGPIQAGGSGWTPTTSPRRPWSGPTCGIRRTTTPAGGSWRRRRASFEAFRRSLASKPVDLIRNLGAPPRAGTCRSMSPNRPGSVRWPDSG